MKHRARTIPFTVIALVVLAVGLWLAGSYFHSKAAVASYKKRLIASGEKLTIPELIPPPVPADANSVGIFLQAARLNNIQSCLVTNQPPAMRLIAPGKAMVGWAQPDIRYYLEMTNSWEEADAALAQYAGVLELLHQVIEHPTLDFGLAYQQGSTLLLPHLGPMKGCAQRLLAAASCHLHRGDIASAITDLRAILALVKGTEQERLVISQLVRIAIAAIAFAANWELLQAPNLTDAQLAALQQDWTELRFFQGAESALAMERAMGLVTMERMKNSSAAFRQMAGLLGSAAPGASTSSTGGWSQVSESLWRGAEMTGKEFMWRAVWSYPDQYRALQGEQALLDAIRYAGTNGCFRDALRQQEQQLARLQLTRASKDEDSGFSMDLDLRSVFSDSVLALDKLIGRVLRIEVSRQLVITAIALKRYQLRHGNNPSDLASLVPELLPAIPHDPVDGQPFRYRRNADGTFLLYGIGEDGADNGGNPEPADSNSSRVQWLLGRDWVWPQPASAEEVQTYYKSLSKRPMRQ